MFPTWIVFLLVKTLKIVVSNFFFFLFLSIHSFVYRATHTHTRCLDLLFTNRSAPIVPSLFFRFRIHCHEHHFPNSPFATEGHHYLPAPWIYHHVPSFVILERAETPISPLKCIISRYNVIYVNNRLIQVFLKVPLPPSFFCFACNVKIKVAAATEELWTSLRRKNENGESIFY